MKKLLEIGDPVKVGDEELTVKTVKKNFGTGEISYRLSDGSVKSHKQLFGGDLKAKVKSKNEDASSGNNAANEKTEIEKVREEYAEVIGKKVANAKKNDKEWMEDKINEAKVEAIQALDIDELSDVIEEKELDIEPSDYEEVEDLCQAVLEELGLVEA